MDHAKYIMYKDKELVLVKHDLDSTKVLRNLGYQAPHPMMHDGYEWPGRYTPMVHQIQTADFATVNRKLFILNATGTGKTGAVIWAMDYLIKRGYVKRVLVICPLSVIKVWQDELFSLVPHYSTGIMTGEKARRRNILNSSAQICVINFDGVSSFYHHDKKEHTKSSELKGMFDLIIVDEASAYRNAGTERYAALDYINEIDTRLWLMSGTPTPNAPTDAWALTRLVSPSRVPGSFNLFRETVMIPAGKYKWVAKIGAMEEVRKVMQPAIRFEKADCIDLPPITYNDRHCDMSEDQRAMFLAMKERMKHEAEDGTITAANAAVKIIKLQQICCGVVKDDDENPVFVNAKPRLDLLLELVQSTNNKVIIFVPFIHAMHLVQKHLEKHGISTALVNGKVSSNERSEIFTAFQNRPDPVALVAHPAVTAHGLTLTAADTIIWYAPIYSLEYYEQANARIERKGQKNAMSVYHMMCHPFEAAIYAVLKKKGSVQSALLDLFRQVTA